MEWICCEEVRLPECVRILDTELGGWIGHIWKTAGVEVGVLGNVFPGCVLLFGLVNGRVRLRFYYCIFFYG